jgi:hypothetical protein
MQLQQENMYPYLVQMGSKDFPQLYGFVVVNLFFT